MCGTGVGVLKGEEAWPFGSVLYRLAECPSCGCAFTVPLPTDRVLRDLYAKMFDYRWYRDHLRAKMRDAAARYAEYRPLLGASVLDFGGGLGYFSAICRARGHVSVTLDAYAPHGGLAPGSQFDTVVALHVLEHANDIDGLILQMRAFPKPGGNLIIAVPNYRSAGYRERGMRWVWAQPPLIPIYHFTAEGLAALLRRRGFRRLEISYHERWDANRHCDLERAEEFAAWDGMWAREGHITGSRCIADSWRCETRGVVSAAWRPLCAQATQPMHHCPNCRSQRSGMRADRGPAAKPPACGGIRNGRV